MGPKWGQSGPMKKPKPDVQKFNLRMPVDLMERAQEQASVMGVSLNAFILMALSDFVRRIDQQARASTDAEAESIIGAPIKSAPKPRASRASTAKATASKPVEPPMPRVGRNEPCPCGSGRKAKHCHPAYC